jgi:hypothetical protein
MAAEEVAIFFAYGSWAWKMVNTIIAELKA